MNEWLNEWTNKQINAIIILVTEVNNESDKMFQ